MRVGFLTLLLLTLCHPRTVRKLTWLLFRFLRCFRPYHPLHLPHENKTHFLENLYPDSYHQPKPPAPPATFCPSSPCKSDLKPLLHLRAPVLFHPSPFEIRISYGYGYAMRVGGLWHDAVVLATVGVVVAGCLGLTLSVYIPENNVANISSAGAKQTRSQQLGRPKTNSLEDAYYKRRSPIFKNDKEIERYLKAYGLDLMLWRCKNAIQPRSTERSPLPFVELYCEVIGTMKKVQWQFNSKTIRTARRSRYTQTVLPHLERKQFYSRWIDFRLRVHNATWRDTGVYVFSATSPNGQTVRQTIYVDISAEKKKKKRNNRVKEVTSDVSEQRT